MLGLMGVITGVGVGFVGVGLAVCSGTGWEETDDEELKLVE